MELNNEYEKIKINNYNEKIKDSSIDKMMNEFFSLAYETNQLILHASIAHMNQIVVSTDEKSIIGTQALDTCFGILFYSRKKKFGICGHASPNNIRGITIEMLKKIPINLEGEIEYAVVPGYRAMEQHNFKQIEEIEKSLAYYMTMVKKIKFVPLKTMINPTMPEGLLCYDFAFDTNHGVDVTNVIFRKMKEEQNRRHI